MNYCKKCRENFEENFCPYCGSEYPVSFEDYPDRDEMDMDMPDIPSDSPKEEQ